MYGGFGEGPTRRWSLELSVFSQRRRQCRPISGEIAAPILRNASPSSRRPRRARATARFSLTISGWVNEAVFWWDDGTEKGVYVGTNLIEQSRVRFVGEAKIDKNWTAGYILELGVQGAPSNQWNQFTEQLDEHQPQQRQQCGLDPQEQLVHLAVGLNGTATYHLLDDADFDAHAKRRRLRRRGDLHVRVPAAAQRRSDRSRGDGLSSTGGPTFCAASTIRLLAKRTARRDPL